MMSDTPNPRAIPSAGPDLEHLLAQDVVIEAGAAVEHAVDKPASANGATGAQREAPDHSPRAPQAGAVAQGRAVPAAGLLTTGLLTGGANLQREVEQFLYRQAELLDDKQWQPYVELFAPDGVYWMPVLPQQTDWEGSPSIFAEDRLMMEIRKGRITHPNAWSQAPMWETNHLVSHVALVAASETEIKVRSRFHFMELRRDNVRHFGGRYQHTLVRAADGTLRIKLQRVDLFNSQAPFDYVLQIWI